MLIVELAGQDGFLSGKAQPILAYYEVENWQEDCELSKTLALGGWATACQYTQKTKK